MNYMILALADIHINTSRYLEYEEEKLRLIRKAILSHPEVSHIVLAGDTFDKAKPTLLDIKLFYDFIHSLSDYTIDIIGGNHDPETFHYLPTVGFRYHSEITTIGPITYIPWTQIQEPFPENDVCFSHARCTIPPHIGEEVDIGKYHKAYKLTVLGDIHSPMEPYEDVVYTSSPVPIHFKTQKANSTGYLIVDPVACSFTRHFINNLAKIKIVTPNENLGALVTKLKKVRTKSLYKVVVEDYAERLQGIQRHATKSIKIEPKILINNKDVSDKVSAVLDQSVEIEDIMFQYLRENYQGFTVQIENNLKEYLG